MVYELPGKDHDLNVYEFKLVADEHAGSILPRRPLAKPSFGQSAVDVESLKVDVSCVLEDGVDVCPREKVDGDGGRRWYGNMISYAEMGDLMVVEAQSPPSRTCYAQSHKFKGICLSFANCSNVCKSEGFPGGRCREITRKCFCIKPCDNNI
ncbi:hypothetical protein R6Q59_030056 [Mikania micrantha]